MSKLIAIAALALALTGPGARAQTYPVRPITLVVPYPAGVPLRAASARASRSARTGWARQ